MEVGWVDDRLRVLEVRGDGPLVGRGKPNVAVDESGIDVVVGVAGEFLERGEQVVARADVGAEETAPEFALWEDAHVHRGHDAEVVGAAAKGFGQVWIGGCISVDDFAGG